MKADKDGFIRPKETVPVKAEPAAKPVKKAVPAAASPAVAPPAAKPVSDITSNGFMKADKDGFIKSK
jgi:hypothetical protein